MGNLRCKLSELGIDEETAEKIMDAKYEEDREERRNDRIDDLENKVAKLQKEVAELTKAALGAKSKPKDKDGDDDLDGIIDAVVKDRIW
jgi:hypothetical protein